MVEERILDKTTAWRYSSSSPLRILADQWSQGEAKGINANGRAESIEECVLSYRDQQLTPEDYLRFVELDEFRDDWKRLGLDDDDLWTLHHAQCSPSP